MGCLKTWCQNLEGGSFGHARRLAAVHAEGIACTEATAVRIFTCALATTKARWSLAGLLLDAVKLDVGDGPSPARGTCIRLHDTRLSAQRASGTGSSMSCVRVAPALRIPVQLHFADHKHLQNCH